MPRKGEDWITPEPAPPGEDVTVTALTAGVVELTGEVRTLRVRVESDRRLRRTVLALIFAVLIVVVLFAVYVTSLYGQVKAGNHILVECTTPSRDGDVHECYDEGRRTTASNVARIVDSNGNGIPDTQEILEALNRAATTTTTTTPARPRSAVASRSKTTVAAVRATSGPCGGWTALVASYDWPADTACRILMCESRGDPNARNGKYHSLFQVANGSFDPAENIAQAFAMWSHRGWQPWTCS